MRYFVLFFFKQKTAYEMRISDWSSDVCSSDLVLRFELGQLDRGPQQSDAATRHDAFLDRGAGRVEGVVDAVLALFHLDLGGPADADHRHAAGQLRQALLQLFAVVVRGGFLDLRLDLAAAGLDVRLLAGAAHHRCLVLGADYRSEYRRVGKECLSTCISRGSPYN